MKKTTTLRKAIMEDEYLPKGRIEDKYKGEKKIVGKK
jgi:hypothetical protein